MSYIKVEDLSLGYDSEIVCSNINFEINKNDYLCIIGENGAGKSTLIKTILDLKEKKAGKDVYKRQAHKALAREVITFLHGEGAYEEAVQVSQTLFSGQIQNLTLEQRCV